MRDGQFGMRLPGTARTLGLALAVLGSVAAQAPEVELFKWARRTVELPLQNNPADAARLKELRLHTSSDRGKTWHMAQTLGPSVSNVQWEAPADGEHWFSIVEIDKAGRANPAKVEKEPPQMRILIDTVKPFLEVLPQNIPDENVAGVVWRIEDANIDIDSFSLEVAEGDGAFKPVKVDGRMGRRSWPRSDPAAPTVVRARVADRCRNETVTTITLPPFGGADPRLKRDRGAATAARSDAGRRPDPTEMDEEGIPPPPPPAGRSTRRSTEMAGSAEPPRPAVSAPPSRDTLDALAGSTSVTAAKPAAPERKVFDRNRPDFPSEGQAIPVAGATASRLAPKTDFTNATGSGRRSIEDPEVREAGAFDRNMMLEIARKPLAHSPAAPTGMVVPPDPAKHSPGAADGPMVSKSLKPAPKPPFISNTPRIAVNYGVRKIGPSGVGKVELFYTQDNGQSWKSAGVDEDRMSPIEVELPGEGRYGLKVVVTNPAGLGMKPPVQGERPELFVEIDDMRPGVTLNEPVPVMNADADTLMLSWEATDKNLAPGPVTIVFYEDPNGPAWLIEQNLPAKGEYKWRLPEGIPSQVYIKVIARDWADNVNSAITPKPVLVDFTRPEADLIDVWAAPVRKSTTR